MPETLNVELCAIGGGSGGRTVAAAARQLGVSTVLVEKIRMGGDCLNYGCVPSKALLAAGHAAEAVRRASGFGIHATICKIDPMGVHRHLHDTIGAIAPADSVEHFEDLGVKVILAPARFVSPGELVAGEHRVRARWFVVSSGSSPQVPNIAGLTSTPFLTNETIFDLQELPQQLVVIGGGPIGIEIAQAYRHLGVEVTVIEQAEILPKEDSELVAILRARLQRDGIDLRERTRVVSVETCGGGVDILCEESGAQSKVWASHLLVATGRRPNVDDLGLEAAGIAYTKAGIRVDERLRTTNRRVFAIGDVLGGPQFTHLVVHHARVVIRNALWRIPTKVDVRALSRVTYTAPELAHAGLTEEEARQQCGKVRVLRWPYEKNDRAQAERAAEGLVKVATTARGRVLGAGIVGPQAGEVIQKWVMAISQNIDIGAMSRIIAPYPTIGYSDRKLADTFFAPALASRRTRRFVRFLSHLRLF